MRLCVQSAAHPSHKRCSCPVISVGVARLQPVGMPSYGHLWYWLKAWLVPGQTGLCRTGWGQEELFLHTLLMQNFIYSIPWFQPGQSSRSLIMKRRPWSCDSSEPSPSCKDTVELYKNGHLSFCHTQIKKEPTFLSTDSASNNSIQQKSSLRALLKSNGSDKRAGLSATLLCETVPVLWVGWCEDALCGLFYVV